MTVGRLDNLEQRVREMLSIYLDLYNLTTHSQCVLKCDNSKLQFYYNTLLRAIDSRETNNSLKLDLKTKLSKIEWMFN